MSAWTTIFLIEANSSRAAEVGWNLFLLYHSQFIILIIIRSFGAMYSEFPTISLNTIHKTQHWLISFLVFL